MGGMRQHLFTPAESSELFAQIGVDKNARRESWNCAVLVDEFRGSEAKAPNWDHYIPRFPSLMTCPSRPSGSSLFKIPTQYVSEYKGSPVAASKITLLVLRYLEQDHCS
jgi:hypothetical protein